MPWPLFRRLLVVVLVLYWVALFLGTHVPGDAVDSKLNDKLLHFGAYAGLAALLMWTISPQRHAFSVTLAALAGLSLYGLIDELLQIPIASRNCDPVDLMADVAGCVSGLIVYWLARSLPEFGRS